MSFITQLNPSIPLNTPKGDGEAILVLDYGVEHDLIFVVLLDSNGECWSFRNSEVRGIKNITIGRKLNE
jgi:hypothetical protein